MRKALFCFCSLSYGNKKSYEFAERNEPLADGMPGINEMMHQFIFKQLQYPIV